MTLYNYDHLSAMQSEMKTFVNDCNSIYHLCSGYAVVDDSFIATVDDTILSSMNEKCRMFN